MPEDPSNTPSETPPPTGEPAAPAPSPATEPPKTFTQEELDRYAGRRAGEVQRKTKQEIADQLGVSLDDAKKIIEAAREAEAAAKTEAQRELEAASQAKAEAEKAKADAAAERFQSKLERKLYAAGVGAGLTDSEDDQRKRDGLMARALRMVDLAPDADDEAIAAEIEQIKADVPGLFTTATASSAPSGVTPSKPPTGGQPQTSALDKGRERARAMRPDPSKTNDPFAGPAFRKVG